MSPPQDEGILLGMLFDPMNYVGVKGPGTHSKEIQVANRLSIVAMCSLWFLTLSCAQESYVNFNHLQHLTETISMGGENVDIVHVYANYPDYRWMEAAEMPVRKVSRALTSLQPGQRWSICGTTS